MKYFITLAILCLLISTNSIAQPIIKDSLDNYYIRDSVLVITRDAAEISVVVVQRKDRTEPQAAILMFSIYARQTDIKKAMEAADHGYTGVLAYTRGKRLSSSGLVVYEKDGQDVYDVIEWITQQDWSNDKVGMYGGSYNGFTQWAATKNLHPALKTIVPSAAAAPGLDAPMMNNVVMNFQFPWTYYVSNNKWLDNQDYNNRRQWNDLEQKYFLTGSSFRSLDSLLGRSKNNIFRRWLDHPLYDKFWQDMIPYKKDFSKINIPILTTTGYYDGGQVGALYYLREHYTYNPAADHYLLIGPYGHFGCQGYPDSVYNGYRIDETARIPIHTIIYQWLDHILKGAAKPSVLKDKINYQLMGADQWKTAASLSAISKDTLKFYLHYKDSGILARKKPSQPASKLLQVNFKDRIDMHSYYYAFRIIWDSLFDGGGIMYKTPPLEDAVEFTGNFTGEMKVTINKKDMDYSAVLFEQRPDGTYFYLSYFMGRASHAKDVSKRVLLTPGKKTSLPFSNTYFTSKLLSKGSRLVLIVNINKSSAEQINYGTGKDVNDETMEDAGEPIKIQWHNDSFIRIPVIVNH